MEIKRSWQAGLGMLDVRVQGLATAYKKEDLKSEGERIFFGGGYFLRGLAVCIYYSIGLKPEKYRLSHSTFCSLFNSSCNSK